MGLCSAKRGESQTAARDMAYKTPRHATKLIHTKARSLAGSEGSQRRALLLASTSNYTLKAIRVPMHRFSAPFSFFSESDSRTEEGTTYSLRIRSSLSRVKLRASLLQR